MPEHIIIINSMGGATALSCQSLGINNIEFPYAELTGEAVKKTILDYLFVKEADVDYDLVIVDNRPPEKKFNEQREKESKEFKKANNQLFSSRMMK